MGGVPVVVVGRVRGAAGARVVLRGSRRLGSYTGQGDRDEPVDRSNGWWPSSALLANRHWTGWAAVGVLAVVLLKVALVGGFGLHRGRARKGR
ncbi:hypothetical protein [Streptomyces sp. NBC_01235]|uniref:hypothetical protein n=1 Tax=Streptomyces sp. NBC_01235 TaxID=2903788 RepID=UPI002E0FAA86|nr:hypothetical protein OG289_07250 [Streptomyces sp. NBC_01235]